MEITRSSDVSCILGYSILLGIRASTLIRIKSKISEGKTLYL